MRFLRATLTALAIGAAAPAFVATGFAQTCACPPTEGFAPGSMIQSEEPPPPLPAYDQPPIPTPGYVWTPGYWAWNTYDYYWVPGVWVPPPQTGLLWTPGYWAFVGGAYLFHAGYWGPHVGFYGGVNYGYGYSGVGYGGGRWEGNRFLYNATVNNFGGVRVANVYTETIAAAPGAARVSYNGGPGGISLKPTPEQERLTTEERVRPTSLQVTQARTASMEATQFRSANQGKPAVAATARPGDLKGPGAVPAKAGGAAELAPASGPNALPTPNGEQKLAPGAKPPASAPNVRPSGAILAPAPPEPRPSLGEKPASPAQTAPGAKPPAASNKETRPFPEKTPGGATKPAGLEKPVRPEAPNRESKAPEAPRSTSAVAAPGVERPRPEQAQGGPKGRAAAERKPQRGEGRERCGGLGEQPCR